MQHQHRWRTSIAALFTAARVSVARSTAIRYKLLVVDGQLLPVCSGASILSTSRASCREF
jgi:hypothetical protein